MESVRSRGAGVPWDAVRRVGQLAVGMGLLVWGINSNLSWVTFTAIFGAIFIPAEALLAFTPQRFFRRRLGNDTMHWFVTTALSAQGMGWVSGIGVGLLAIALHPLGLAGHIVRQPAALQFAEALVLTYLVVYWIHRAMHKYNFLWRFHVIHHSAGEVNWMTAARFHPLDVVIQRGAAVTVVYAMGFSSAALSVYVLYEAFQSIWVHANFDVRIGPIKWLIANPEFHHWHHANDPAVYNKNFCEWPLMDLLFGTAYMPRGKRPAGYGVPQQVPESYVGQLLAPLPSLRSRRREDSPAGTVVGG